MTQTKEEKLKYKRDWARTHYKHRPRGKYLTQPRKKNIQILKLSVGLLQNLDYKVSPRWLYYQLIQRGLISKSSNSWYNFEHFISRARKKFLYGFKPDSLSDSLRTPYFVGHGNSEIDIILNTIELNDFYVQVWFEAQAMFEQFRKYTSEYRVSLVPFRGDISISLKWQLAKYLEDIHIEYPDKPIKILYFGDCDKKGLQIPQSALKDIRSWCNTSFDFEFIGLTLTQAKYYNLPENPEKKNQYQWESLSDSQAQEIILGAIKKYLKVVPQSILDREKELEKKLKEYYDLL